MVRWIDFMDVFNGTVKFIDAQPVTSLQTDASSGGGAGYFQGDYFYANWALDLPRFQSAHINIKETLAIILSAQRWGHMWANKTVIVSTDNMTTKCVINKGSSKNKQLMILLRKLFWLSAAHNFDIKAKFISGKNNYIADSASRLHEPGQLSKLYDILSSYQLMKFTVFELLHHMSLAFYRYRWGANSDRTIGDCDRTIEKQGVG